MAQYPGGLSVIIVNYQKAEAVVKNVASLQRQNFDGPLEIVVIDNSCSEQEASWIRSIDNIQYSIFNKQNEGYTKANNRGVALTKGEYIAILNPDIECPDPLTFQTLVDYLKKHPDVGIVGPQQKTPSGEVETTMRAFPKFWIQVVRRTFLRHVPPFRTAVERDALRHLDETQIQEVDWLQSSFMVLSRSLWEDIGGFDESYFLFMADTEIAYQARKRGKKVVYYPEVFVQADGRRCSEGGPRTFFRSWVLRQHFLDACRYFWKHR